MDYILGFEQISMADVVKVGGKNAALGEMINYLTKLGIKVPGGFALTTQAYYEFLKYNQCDEIIEKNLKNLDISNLQQLQNCSLNIQNAMLRSHIPESISNEMTTAYENLKKQTDIDQVAVRSSATAEDMPEASFAGQQETYLNICGIDKIVEATKRVYASFFSERAISYRYQHGFSLTQKVGISVGIQQMVRSDLGSSGIMFTLDTESGFDQVIFITAAYGLGEIIVQGQVNPDEFYVFKPMLQQGKPAIISRHLGSKIKKMILAKETGVGFQSPLQPVAVPVEDQLRFSLTDQQVLKLSQQALLIENHYKMPMDIEWGLDGVTGELYILQARPETVKRHEAHLIVEQYHLKQAGVIKTSGRSVGNKIGQGAACLIHDIKEMTKMQDNHILVANNTDPDWEPIMKKASAIVTNHGGRTCHAAIVARELGIPAVVGCGDATTKIKEGENITVSCAQGETGYVYADLLKYETDKIEIEQLPKLPLSICMNMANPEQAFQYRFIPNDGVGLTRLEFIISNIIGIHPNACLQLSELPVAIQEEIKHRTKAYGSPIEFYIEKLTEGIATIAAAFYPKSVIIRFSDFKSNEYAHLLGGEQFEPHEENPMLGFRGGSRYLSPRFSGCFALECEAVKRVRDQLGLSNVHVMLPFVRTVDETKALIALLKENGLERNVNYLKIYLMCEIPANIILAQDFLQYVDGYSIGSNDLTQLILGLDRDSELVAHLFDERNPAILNLLEQVITLCKQQNKYIGICGQGPSDHPDFAKWLMEKGISSISLSPDSVISTWLSLAKHL